VPGDLVYLEIRSGDAARAQEFWSSLFGWRFSHDPGEVPYTMAGTPSGATGVGLYRSEEDDRGLLVYFDVDDVDAALERVRELGGEVVEGRTAIPETGWYARCRDTEGNPFNLFQQDASVMSDSGG
jgi:predicted enzyme related to lactoylglutathione lyase